MSCLCAWRASVPSFRSAFDSLIRFFHPPASSVGDKSAKGSATPQPQRHVAATQEPVSSHVVATHEPDKSWMATGIETWEPDVKGKELLRKTWSDEFNFLYDLGSSIYLYIFSHTPECMKLFPWIMKYEGEQWKESKEFRGQALKFVQTIAQVVKNVYHMESLEKFLYEIGHRHVRFASRGFKPEHWDVFQDAMQHALSERMQTIQDEEERNEAVQVWRTLALYIITHMKHGYFDGLESRNKFK